MNDLLTRLLLVLRKHFLKIVLFSVLLMGIFCAFSYAHSFQTASAILAFTYPNASDGLYPNGTFFNAYNILTGEIIENGIRRAGLEGDVNPANLVDEISIKPRSNASLITTQFIVSYRAGRADRLGAVTPEGLLNSIIYSYIDHFHKTYSNERLALNLDLLENENLDYIDLVNYYNMILNQLQKYLSAQQVSDKDFISADGTSFQDLINIVERMRLTALKEVRAIILEQGVSSNPETYLERLDYQIWKLSNTYDNYRKMQNLYKKTLQDYDSRLTSVVFIPSLDAEQKFYMSKTKIGIDLLALNATDYEEKAENVQRQISQKNQYVGRINDPGKSAQDRDNHTSRVNSMFSELRKQLLEIIDRVQQVEKEYSKYKNHDYVMMRPVETSFLNRANGKSAFLVTVVIDILIIAVLVIREQRKVLR
ncbi:MAG: hypothetical protein IKE24_03665 [Clostridia bacterium]|nr:hypothetical protein [Clostridia bacterium]